MQISRLLCLLPLVSAELLPRDSSSPLSSLVSSTAAPSSSSSTTQSGTTTSPPSSITSSASLKAAGSSCGTCTYSAGDHIEWGWPSAELENITVATIIYKVNTIENVTQTITSLATVTATAENNAAGWDSALNTTGVTMKDGTPVLTKVFTIYTETDQYYTTAISLQSPSGYENWGYLVWTATSDSQLFTSTLDSTIVTTGAVCTMAEQETIALTPTAPLPGQTALYQGIVDEAEWAAMIPANITDNCVFDLVSPAGAVSLQNALTATTTEYDDTVHSQTTSSKTSAAADSTKASTSAKESATTKTSTKESSAAPASTKQSSAASVSTAQSSAAPASSQSKSAASQQSQASQQPSTQVAASPASSKAASTPAATHTSTSTSTGTSTVTPVVIASSTLLPGSTAVVSGTTYSLQVTTSGSSTTTNLIANGQTLSASSTAGYGSLIYSGLGGTVTASQGSAVVTTGTSVQIATYTGGARRELVGMGLVGAVGAVVVLL